MGIRDIIVFAAVFLGLPFMLRAPWIGVMFWVWIGLMNPHRETWGLAHSFPFALLIAGATLVGVLFTKEPRQFKGGGAAWALFTFMVWTWLTTAFALVPDDAWKMLDRVFKIQFFTFVALFVLYKRQHVQWLAGVIVLSIGFYSVKGGVFTLATAGNYRVWGPLGSFIYDNNALALATVMTIPLWVYFHRMATNRWLKWAIVGCTLLSVVSALGSYSRGALLAITAMSLFLWLKSQRKIGLGIFTALVAAALIAFMPGKWEERMGTIATYDEDASAMGRLEAWTMLFNLAVDRPIVGGGFEANTQELFDRYNPAASVHRSAHSIYFQVLGEQGFVGFAIFCLIWALTWRLSRQIISLARGQPDLAWAESMATMVQVSLVGYLVGGAFLNLAYWDMPYYLLVLLAVTKHALRSEGSAAAVPRRAGAALDGRQRVTSFP